MSSLVHMGACVILTSLIGWNVLSLLSGRAKCAGLSVTEQAGLSYLFGMGTVSFQIFIYGLLRIDLTGPSILVPWIPVMLANLLRKGAPELTVRDKTNAKSRPFEAILFLLIAVQTVYTFFKAFIRPLESYDAVAIYGLKAKVFYLSGVVNGELLRRIGSVFNGAHPDYPLLMPLSETWVYTFLGRFDDYLVKAIFPLFFVSFIFVFYAALKRTVKRRGLALLFVFGLVSVKQFSDYAAIGYADMELGVYFATSLAYLYAWMRDRKAVFLNISLASSLLCVWTKNEGTLLCLINLFILLVYALTNIKNINKKKMVHVACYISAPLLLIGGWEFFKNANGLTNENFNLSMLGFNNLISGIGKVSGILYGYQREFFGPKKWNLAWILFFALFLTQFKHVFSKNIRYVTAVFFLFALGYCAMYVFSAVDIGYFVRVTASRFLLHILPVALFWSALVISERKLIEDI